VLRGATRVTVARGGALRAAPAAEWQYLPAGVRRATAAQAAAAARKLIHLAARKLIHPAG